MTRFHQMLQDLGSRKKYAAFVLGALMVLAMPPFGFFPILLVSVPGFIWLALQDKTPLRAFCTGWIFGSGYFIFGFYWISVALFVDIKTFWGVLPLSLIVGPVVLALFYGFITLLAYPFRKNPSAYAIAFSAAWAIVEFTRGHIFTGFPWNVPGYSWDYLLPVMQVSAFTSVYGLSLLTVFWAATPVFKNDKKLALFSIASFILVLAGGGLRLWQNPTRFSDSTVRIVQANISQTMKWDDDSEVRNLEKHLALTRQKDKSQKSPTFVLWPETSVGSDLNLFPETARYIAMSIPQGTTAILGDLRITQDKSGIPSFFNSVAVMNKDAKVLATYDKHHLVPFGEYIPFRKQLNMTPVALAVANVGDFTRGPGAQTLHIGALPSFSPLICYEVIFPGLVVDKTDRPDWLVNVTNDAWYGNSTGPYQHLGIARMRAVEEGLPLARAANTGISAMVDPLGRVIDSIPLLESGAIDTKLPKPLPPTVYALYGDKIFYMLTALFLAVAALRLYKNPENLSA